MGDAININIRDLATTEMQRLAAGVEAPQLREAIGLAGVAEVQEYYTRLDHERPNEIGGKRTHFYAQAAESALWEDTGDGVLLDIKEPIGLRQRIHGGPIVPGPSKKYLTIAACAEAYGHRAGEFTDLVPVFRRRGGTVEAIGLAQAAQTPVDAAKRSTRIADAGGVKRSRPKGGKMFFWLVKSVSQEADPTAAPDEGQLRTAVIGAVSSYFRALQGSVVT